MRSPLVAQSTCPSRHPEPPGFTSIARERPHAGSLLWIRGLAGLRTSLRPWGRPGPSLPSSYTEERMRKTSPKLPNRPNRRTMCPRAPEPPLENALYVGIDISQEHLDAAVFDARGNLLRAAQRYENTGPGSEKLWDDAQALGRAPSRRPVAYAMEASGIYHLGCSPSSSRRTPGPGRSTRFSSRGRSRAGSARPRPTRSTPSSSPSSRGRKGPSTDPPPSTMIPLVFGSTVGSPSAASRRPRTPSANCAGTWTSSARGSPPSSPTSAHRWPSPS